MTNIDFYFNAGDRLQVACRLAAKAAAQRKRMLIYAPDGGTAGAIDKMLWTWQAVGSGERPWCYWQVMPSRRPRLVTVDYGRALRICSVGWRR